MQNCSVIKRSSLAAIWKKNYKAKWILYLRQPRWPSLHRMLSKHENDNAVSIPLEEQKTKCACRLKALCRGRLSNLNFFYPMIGALLLPSSVGVHVHSTNLRRVLFQALIWEGSFPVALGLLLLCLYIRIPPLLIKILYMNLISRICVFPYFLLSSVPSYPMSCFFQRTDVVLLRFLYVTCICISACNCIKTGSWFFKNGAQT